MNKPLKPGWQQCPIKVVSFDLDDTLWPVTDTITKAFTAQDRWFEQRFPQLCQKAARQWVNDRLPTIKQKPGGHCMTYTRKQTLKEFFIESGFSLREAEDHAEEGFAAFYAHRNHVTPFEGIVEFLTRLKEKAFLASLTNGNANVEMTPLKSNFDVNFTPQIVGTCKPDPAMFHVLTTHFNVMPQEILHVGDHYKEDVQGALDAGLHALWIVHDHEPARRTHSERAKMDDWLFRHQQAPIAPLVTSVAALKQVLLHEVTYAVRK